MTWYNPATWIQKANPAQETIANHEGSNIPSDAPPDFLTAYRKLEAEVNP